MVGHLIKLPFKEHIALLETNWQNGVPVVACVELHYKREGGVMSGFYTLPISSAYTITHLYQLCDLFQSYNPNTPVSFQTISVSHC